MRSRWAVETPGLSSASTRSRTSATIAPARRMRSISARDLRVTIRPAPVAERGGQVATDGIDRLAAVDRAEDAGGAVVIGDLLERGHLLRHPGADGRLLVVRALDQRGAVQVASAGALGRVGRDVVDVPVRLADPPAGHPRDEVVERHVDVQGAVDPLALLDQRTVERLCLCARPRKAVEDRAVGRTGCAAGRGRSGRSCRPGSADRDSCSGRPRGRAASRRQRRPGGGRPTRGPAR